MTGVARLLLELRDRRIEVAVDADGGLSLRGPGASITDELRDRVRACKAEVIGHIGIQHRSPHDDPVYPPREVRFNRPTHFLDGTPAVCWVHADTRFADGFRWELLVSPQPVGDGLIGWAVLSDDCYLEIIRRGGIVRTLARPSTMTTNQLRMVVR